MDRSIKKILNLAYKRISGYLEQFNYSVNVYWKNSNIDFKLLCDQTMKNQVDVFEIMFKLFRFQLEKIENTPKVIDSGLLRINCTEIRAEISIAEVLRMCLLMILLQVHLRKPCYDFSFL